MKPAAIPNIDLGARFCVIDDSGAKPVFKTLTRGYATTKRALEVAVEHGLPGVWMIDGLGYRSYVTVKGGAA